MLSRMKHTDQFQFVLMIAKNIVELEQKLEDAVVELGAAIQGTVSSRKHSKPIRQPTRASRKVPNKPEKVTTRDGIVAILGDGRVHKAQDIASELGARLNTVHAALAVLMKDKKVTRPHYGHYQLKK